MIGFKRVAGLTWLVVAAGCTHVAVTDAGAGIRGEPRPDDCGIAFFRTKLPERSYDELAALHWQGSNLSSAVAAQEGLRVSACRLGADAVIVTRDYVRGTQTASGIMTGTAIKYRTDPAAPSAGATQAPGSDSMLLGTSGEAVGGSPATRPERPEESL